MAYDWYEFFIADLVFGGRDSFLAKMDVPRM